MTFSGFKDLGTLKVALPHEAPEFFFWFPLPLPAPHPPNPLHIVKSLLGISQSLLPYKENWHAIFAPPPPPPTPRSRDALEGEGPQRRPQKRLDRQLEEVAKAVGGGYCRLQMPLRLAPGVREPVAGHRLGALGGRGGGYLPPSNASLPGSTPPPPRVQEPPCARTNPWFRGRILASLFLPG